MPEHMPRFLPPLLGYNWCMGYRCPSFSAASRAIAVTVAAALLLWLVLGAARVASGQESPDEVRIHSGPYDIRALLVNSNLPVGFLQLSVLVRNAATGEPVPDARVVLITRHLKDDYEGWATALNSPVLPEQYDVRLNLDSTGEWIISVDVDSPLGQAGGQITTVEVPALKRNTSGSLVFFGVFAVLVGGVAYLWWSVRRDRRRQAARE